MRSQGPSTNSGSYIEQVSSSIHSYPSIYLFICLSIHPSVLPLVCPHIHPFHLFMNPSIPLPVYSSNHLFILSPVDEAIHLSVYLSIHLTSFHLAINLSIHQLTPCKALLRPWFALSHLILEPQTHVMSYKLNAFLL